MDKVNWLPLFMMSTTAVLTITLPSGGGVPVPAITIQALHQPASAVKESLVRQRLEYDKE